MASSAAVQGAPRGLTTTLAHWRHREPGKVPLRKALRAGSYRGPEMELSPACCLAANAAGTGAQALSERTQASPGLCFSLPRDS